MNSIQHFGHTIQGRRAENQDSILHVEPARGAFFLAVADGMGGAAGGQVASSEVLKLAAHVIDDAFASSTPPTLETLRPLLHDLYRRAQQLLRERVLLEPELEGLGTTLTCVLGLGDRFVVANIGDSRTYRLRAGDVEQLTTDHTYVADMQRTQPGVPIDADFVHSFGHIITRSLDGGDDVPDLFPAAGGTFALEEGDLLLLCSDGLFPDKVDAPSIPLNAHSPGSDLEVLAHMLVDYAYESGSTDNISVVVARRPFDLSDHRSINDTYATEASETTRRVQTLPRSSPPQSDSASAPWAGSDIAPAPRPKKKESTGLVVAVLTFTALALAGFGYYAGWFDGLLATAPPQLVAPQTVTLNDTLDVGQPAIFLASPTDPIEAPTVRLQLSQPFVPLDLLSDQPAGVYNWHLVSPVDSTSLGRSGSFELLEGKR
ncbi:MAG: protein phosphatase 2C domain-containing protein [Bacteroidota bacterium]